MKRISVDGLIGAGKSSVMHAVFSHLRIPFHLEPVSEWLDLLRLMYEDPARWATTFNVSVLLSMNDTIKLSETNEATSKLVAHERSPLSCRYVFAELQKDLGYITDAEMSIIERAFRQTSWLPDVVIYVRVSPERAFERVLSRGRNCELCEGGVDNKYLELLFDKYEQVMTRHIPALFPNVDVVIVDGNKPLRQVCEDVLNAVSRIIVAA